MRDTDRAIIIERFKRVYNQIDKENLHLLEEIYTDDIRLTDPFHDIQGMDKLKPYFAKLYEGVRSIRFAFEDEVIGNGKASVTWTMHLDHKSLSRKAIVPGVTFMEFGEKIHLHRDYFDAGAMLYENIWGLGGIIRTIKARL